jgi:hypothetical protein
VTALNAKAQEAAGRMLWALHSTDSDPKWEQLSLSTRAYWRWKAITVVHAAFPHLGEAPTQHVHVNEIDLRRRP